MEKSTNNSWEKPEITDLGSAKDLIKNVNVTGGGDTQFSVLLPS
tara:strand:- start:1306 stop:1437 length:132 start_codon:yes stop_codon:yes gene_type:complete